VARGRRRLGPREWDVGRDVPFPPIEGSGEEAVPRIFFDF